MASIKNSPNYSPNYSSNFDPDHIWQSKKWLAHLLQLPLEQVLSFKLETLEPKIKLEFETGCKKLEQGYPLDYLIGEVEFCGNMFVVNENVLVPRPETEQWVQRLILELSLEMELDSKKGFQKTLLVDIATGSGVIGLSLIKNLPECFSGLILSDIDEQALAVCQQNVANLLCGDKTELVLADGLPLEKIQEEIENQIQGLTRGNQKWILTANLPYLPNLFTDLLPKDSKLAFEPQIALYSGADGLDCFTKVLTQISKIKNKSNIKPIKVYFELDPRNIKIAELVLQSIGYQTTIWQDFNGLDRVLVGALK